MLETSFISPGLTAAKNLIIHHKSNMRAFDFLLKRYSQIPKINKKKKGIIKEKRNIFGKKSKLKFCFKSPGQRKQ